MYSSKLSAPLKLKSHDIIQNINNLYSFYKEDFMSQTNRNKLFGKFIYLDCTSWINHKNEVFWHLISLNKNEQYNIFPCNNCVSYSFCPLNCETAEHKVFIKKGTEQRNICLYRGIRINWINEIITLANIGDKDIRYWTEPTENSKGDKVYIRFLNEGVDYTIILKERYQKGKFKDYAFITAFPTFYRNKKKEFDKKYTEFQRLTV